MEKNMMMTTTPAMAFKGIMYKAVGKAKAPVRWLCDYYSAVCGRPLTMGQTVLLLNTQAAFLAAALPAEMPLAARLACCVWLIMSLRECKRKI